MNEIIEQILDAIPPRPSAKVRLNPAVLESLLGEKDANGCHFIHVDAFDKSEWAICGFALIEDAQVETWRFDDDQ